MERIPARRRELDFPAGASERQRLRGALERPPPNVAVTVPEVGKQQPACPKTTASKVAVAVYRATLCCTVTLPLRTRVDPETMKVTGLPVETVTSTIFVGATSPATSAVKWLPLMASEPPPVAQPPAPHVAISPPLVGGGETLASQPVPARFVSCVIPYFPRSPSNSAAQTSTGRARGRHSSASGTRPYRTRSLRTLGRMDGAASGGRRSAASGAGRSLRRLRSLPSC